jgi:hypothetical protein
MAWKALNDDYEGSFCSGLTVLMARRLARTLSIALEKNKIDEGAWLRHRLEEMASLAHDRHGRLLAACQGKRQRR